MLNVKFCAMQPACQAGPARFRASNAAAQRRLSIATTALSVNKCLTSNFVRRNQRAKQVRHDSGRPALPCSDDLAHDDPRKLSPDQPVKRLWRSQRFPQSGPRGLKDTAKWGRRLRPPQNPNDYADWLQSPNSTRVNQPSFCKSGSKLSTSLKRRSIRSYPCQQRR
jgi:hypothetical protein